MPCWSLRPLRPLLSSESLQKCVCAVCVSTALSLKSYIRLHRLPGVWKSFSGSDTVISPRTLCRWLPPTLTSLVFFKHTLKVIFLNTCYEIGYALTLSLNYFIPKKLDQPTLTIPVSLIQNRVKLPHIFQYSYVNLTQAQHSLLKS